MTKVALITGAARGIGLATAKRFLAEGYAVALLDIDGETLARAAASLSGRTLALTCDVARADQIESSLSRVKREFGSLDALVNNAGTAVFKPALETTLAEFQRTMDVNLTGPFLMVKAAAPLMQKGAAIVNITSISGLRASAQASPMPRAAPVTMAAGRVMRQAPPCGCGPPPATPERR